MAQYTHLIDLTTMKLFSIQVQVNTCTTSRSWNSKIPNSGSTECKQIHQPIREVRLCRFLAQKSSSVLFYSRNQHQWNLTPDGMTRSRIWCRIYGTRCWSVCQGLKSQTSENVTLKYHYISPVQTSAGTLITNAKMLLLYSVVSSLVINPTHS